MFQPVNLSCYDKSQQAQGKLPVCQYWHEEDTLSDMTDIKYYDQKYLKQLMNGLDFVLRVFSKKESSESALVFVYDKVTNLYNLRQLGSGSGGKDYSKEIESLENAVSVLTTSVELSTEIGQTTTVLLDELLTLDVDGRPDYKAPGATVYAENGVTGIIDTIDNSMQTAIVKTVSVSTGGGGGASLPDQTGNAGKFLMTNGTTASWGNALVNLANPEKPSIQIRGDYKAATYPDVLRSCSVSYGGYVAAHDALAIGYTACILSTGGGAIQLGSGQNGDANTFKVANRNGNFELMSADGTIPAERMSATAGTTGQILTKTDTGMEWQDATGGGGGELPDNVLVNNATGYGSLQIFGNPYLTVSGTFSVVVGHNAYARYNYCTALGYAAAAEAEGAIQLGDGKNADANTFKVANRNGNFEMMSADGSIPAERLTKILQDKTSDNTVLQFGDKVIQSGVITIGVVNPKVANSNNPVSLAVAMDMTTPYTIICTPSNTAEAFDRLIADYGNQTANGFEICVRNLSEDIVAANVVVSWMVIGKVSG